MKILDDLISNLDFDAPVQDIRLGVFHTAVLTRHCGLAATLPQDALEQDGPLVKNPGDLLKKSARELVQLAYSEYLLEASIGMATINSLLEVDEDRCVELNAFDLIAEKGKGKRIAIVGHFPFTPKLREIAGELWVIEKRPREGDFTEDQAENLIGNADVVGLTGSAVINHSLEHLLTLCRPHSYVVVLGGTAPLSPILFDYGADAVSGTRVVDDELVLRSISQGANFRQVKGIRKLTMVK